MELDDHILKVQLVINNDLRSCLLSMVLNVGVQIHSWGKLWEDESPNLEFVQPVNVYTVVNGEKTALDVNKIPALTPRQIRELSAARAAKVTTSERARSTETPLYLLLRLHLILFWWRL